MSVHLSHAALAELAGKQAVEIAALKDRLEKFKDAVKDMIYYGHVDWNDRGFKAALAEVRELLKGDK